MVVYLALVRPFKSRCETCLTLLNEIILMLLALLFLLFQSLAETMSDEVLSILGAIMILSMVVCFVSNLLPLLIKMLISLFKPLCRRCRRKKYRSKALKYLQNIRVHPDCKRPLIVAGTDFSISKALHNNFMEKK